MSESDRPSIFVHLMPSLIPPGALRGGVVVVVDVLRATTVMIQALASGCAAIVPCGVIDEATALAASLPAGSALRAGERQGLPIPGFDLANSPADFTPEVCRGKTLVMTTTNGTRAILASREADRVYVTAFSNLGATGAVLRDDPRPVHVVGAGTDGTISLEDTLLAGALVMNLTDRAAGNDEALIARGLWSESEANLERVLESGRGGRRVSEIGLAADVHEAARIDVHQFTASLRSEPLRIVRD